MESAAVQKSLRSRSPGTGAPAYHPFGLPTARYCWQRLTPGVMHGELTPSTWKPSESTTKSIAVAGSSSDKRWSRKSLIHTPGW